MNGFRSISDSEVADTTPRDSPPRGNNLLGDHSSSSGLLPSTSTSMLNDTSISRRTSTIFDREQSTLVWVDPKEEAIVQQIEAVDSQISGHGAFLDRALNDFQTRFPGPQSQEVLTYIQEMHDKLNTKIMLQSSLIDIKSNLMIRNRKYTERCELKIVNWRERFETMERELNTKIEMLERKMKQVEEGATANAVMVEVVNSKFNALKSEYFMNLLTTHGRRLTKFGTENAAQKALKETFENYLEAKEEQLRMMVRAYAKLDMEGGLDLKATNMHQLEDKITSSSTATVTSGPTGRVSLIFTDVQGSTEMWDKEEVAMEAGLEMHNTILRKLLAKYDGYEVKTEGDAFMVAFSSPVNALQWAVEAQHELLRAEWPVALLAFPGAGKVTDPNGTLLFNGIRVRMGIHIGNPKCEVDPCTKRLDYFGPMVNLSARISSRAQGGQIVASTEFLEAVEKALLQIGEGVEATSLGPQSFKGISRPIEIFQMTPKGLRGRSFEAPAAKPDPEAEKEDFFVDAPMKMNPDFVAAALDRISKRKVPVGGNVHLDKVLSFIVMMQSELRWLKSNIQEVVQRFLTECQSIVQTNGNALLDMYRLYMAAKDETRAILRRRQSATANASSSTNLKAAAASQKEDLPKTPHFPDELMNLEWFAPLVKEAADLRRRTMSFRSAARMVVSSGSSFRLAGIPSLGPPANGEPLQNDQPELPASSSIERVSGGTPRQKNRRAISVDKPLKLNSDELSPLVLPTSLAKPLPSSTNGADQSTSSVIRKEETNGNTTGDESPVKGLAFALKSPPSAGPSPPSLGRTTSFQRRVSLPLGSPSLAFGGGLPIPSSSSTTGVTTNNFSPPRIIASLSTTTNTSPGRRESTTAGRLSTIALPPPTTLPALSFRAQSKA